MKRLDIVQVWDDFEPLAAPAMTGEDDGPDDIRAACEAGSAWLFGNEDGYLVLQHQLRPATRTMQLLIWLALSRGPRGCIERNFIWVQELARRLGASRVLFRTRRRGFGRALPAAWTLDHVAWAWEVDDGEG